MRTITIEVEEDFGLAGYEVVAFRRVDPAKDTWMGVTGSEIYHPDNSVSKVYGNRFILVKRED